MDVLRHKMFDCSPVYDKDFLGRDESGGFSEKIDEIWKKAAAFGTKMDEWNKFGFFYQASLNAAI